MITTLIPAYKPQFIDEVLLGLANQTFKNFKVILSDDSPDNVVTKIVKSNKLKHIVDKLNLEVIEGPKNGSMANISNLIGYWNNSSDYVHLLFDDDAVFPLFYQMHMLAHSKYQLGASVSQRWTASESSQPNAKPKTPLRIIESEKVIDVFDSHQLINTVFPNVNNWLGEMSNIVLTKESVDIYEQSSYEAMPYYGLSDIGTMMQLSLTQNIGVINHHLSFFRKSEFQNSGNKASVSMKCAYIAWISLILMGVNSNKISKEVANASLSKICRLILNDYPNDKEMLDFAYLPLSAEIDSEKFKNEFNLRWQQLLAQDASWKQSCQMRASR